MKFSEGLRKGLAIREKLGRPYLLEGVRSPSADELERCRATVRRFVENTV